MSAKLTMSDQDVMQYWSNNKYAAMMISRATSDYTAARCCILNALFPGFTLASQAIEKLLKAMIYLESHNEMKSCHDPFKLKEQLKTLRDYDLDKYDTILRKLYDHYQSRYHNNKTTGAGASSTELPDIDALWLELIHKLPVPDEAKYRIDFFDFLFDPNPFWSNDYWLKTANSAIESTLHSMAVKYQEIQKHLYPTE